MSSQRGARPQIKSLANPRKAKRMWVFGNRISRIDTRVTRPYSSLSQRTLTNQLRELETDGLIKRTVYPEVPPHVEYSITKKGQSLENILDLMCDWGQQNMDERFELTNPQCIE